MEGLGQAPFLIAIFAIFFIFMILPQMRRQKAEKKFASELKKGDKVMMKSGLHGKISELNDKDNTCVVETMAGRLKFDRSAISMELSKKLNPAPAKK